MNLRRKAFTLIEILSVVVIGVFILFVTYKMLTHTLGYFFKGQTKLTNLRMANLVIEHIKSDIRASVFSPKNISDSQPKYTIEDNYLAFWILDKSKLNQQEEKYVEYKYENGIVKRIIDGQGKSLTGKVKIKDLKFEEREEEKNGNKKKCFVVSLVVDKDKDLEDNARSESNKKNIVSLNTVLYPKFFIECMTDEEKYWAEARGINLDENSNP